MGQSCAITQGLRVEVVSEYVPGRSDPGAGDYFFAYQVTISNEGEAPAKLLTRHWTITDADGNEQHIRGPGVVGESPRLMPGERFRYTSACPLPSPVGAMRGSYQMVRDDGRLFDAEIAPFTLAVPYAIN